jgi:membrane associated rhomboid family serine protease
VPTAWRRFALFGVAFVLLAVGDVVRAVLSSNLGAAAGRHVGASVMAALAVLYLRQTILRRRAGSSRG